VAPLKLSIAIVFETLNHSSLQIPEYLIIIEKAENNYSAHCPDLPGVIAHRSNGNGNTRVDERGNRVSSGRAEGRVSEHP
jgi:hypothetical protein